MENGKHLEITTYRNGSGCKIQDLTFLMDGKRGAVNFLTFAIFCGTLLTMLTNFMKRKDQRSEEESSKLKAQMAESRSQGSEKPEF
jgi:hypothetical protein